MPEGALSASSALLDLARCTAGKVIARRPDRDENSSWNGIAARLERLERRGVVGEILVDGCSRNCSARRSSAGPCPSSRGCASKRWTGRLVRPHHIGPDPRNGTRRRLRRSATVSRSSASAGSTGRRRSRAGRGSATPGLKVNLTGMRPEHLDLLALSGRHDAVIGRALVAADGLEGEDHVLRRHRRAVGELRLGAQVEDHPGPRSSGYSIVSHSRQ